METFVYSSVNRGSFNNENDIIDTLGPFSYALSAILRGDASARRRDSDKIKSFREKLYFPMSSSDKMKY